MSQLSRISELSAIIQTNTSKIDEYLSTNGLPPFSFDTHSSAKPPDAISMFQTAILEATDELNALIQGPVPFIINLTVSNHNSLISLHAIYRFNIATSIPLDSTATFAQIASRCNLSEDDTRRLLRHAMTLRIFREPQKGVVAHTAASRALAETLHLRQWIGQSCEDMWPAATRVVEAMARWPGSEEPNEAGFNVANGTDEAIYKVIGKDQARAQRFADAMSLFHQRPGLDMRFLLEGYEWVASAGDDDRATATKGVVEGEEEEAVNGAGATRTLDGARGPPATTVFVDIGGSHGPVSIALAERFPSFQCIVQDLPEVVEKAQAPPELASRVKFMAHDFFEPQPVSGADIYYFRWILHNWSDKYALKILRSLVPAMKHGARVIVSEYCVPAHGAVSLFRERGVRASDMAMKEVQNAKERDADDWARLFEAADGRFVLREIREPDGSDLAIIVAEWVAEEDKVEGEAKRPE